MADHRQLQTAVGSSRHFIVISRLSYDVLKLLGLVEELHFVRAGLAVKHASGKAWGHQLFAVWLPRTGKSYLAKYFLRHESDQKPEDSMWGATVQFQRGKDDFSVGFFKITAIAVSTEPPPRVYRSLLECAQGVR